MLNCSISDVVCRTHIFRNHSQDIVKFQDSGLCMSGAAHITMYYSVISVVTL